jgi:hypothetical protein
MICRYLHILFTCRLGFHAPYLQRPVTEGVKTLECPRCHRTVVATRNSRWFVFNRPSAWDVARGLYDRPQDHWGGE